VNGGPEAGRYLVIEVVSSLNGLHFRSRNHKAKAGPHPE
jgi:hypothetical protein